MDKREFVQRYMIENYNGGNVYHDINAAVTIFNAIEETLNNPQPTNLWGRSDN